MGRPLALDSSIAVLHCQGYSGAKQGVAFVGVLSHVLSSVELGGVGKTPSTRLPVGSPV